MNSIDMGHPSSDVPDEEIDRHFLGEAMKLSVMSDDRSTKIGAVIVGPGNEILSGGYNSFPSGLSDKIEARHQRPEKYFWIEHAERNAIYKAARGGIPLEGSRIYVQMFPCMDCARSIVQTGITEVIVATSCDREFDDRWREHHERAATLFEETGTSVRFVTMEAPINDQDVELSGACDEPHECEPDMQLRCA